MEGIKPLNLSKLWQYLRSHLKEERTYILPTKLGIYYTVLCFLLLGVAFIYNNNISYFSCFTLVSLGIITLFQTNYNMHRIHFTVLNLSDIHAEQVCSLRILLENKTSVASHFIHVHFDSKQKNIAFKDLSQEKIEVRHIGPNEKIEIELSLIFTQRGYQKLPRLVLETRFPFGFLRSWKWIQTSQPILVYPSKKGNLPLPRDTMEGDESLYDKNKIHLRGQDFQGHRPYQDSDSIRNIDWKAYARIQKLNVKLFDNENLGSQYLSWKSTQSLPQIEERISQLTQWVYLCQRKRMEFLLELPNWKSPLSDTQQHIQECYRHLALYSGSL